MRIGIFSETYEPYVSGVTTSIKMLKEALENLNHEVYIVTVNLKNYQFIYDRDNKIIYIPGIKTKIYDARLTGIYSKKAFKIIKTWNLDLIHSQTEFGIGYFSRIVSKKLNIPVVHTYHTLYEDYVHYVTHNHFNNISKKIAIKITKYYCEKKCDSLIVPTSKIKDLFINKYNIKKEINVIPTGIDTNRFQNVDKKQVTNLKKEYNLNANDFVIGCVGRIATEKSIDDLLTNSKDLIKKYPHLKLLIVGDGPELANLKELASKLNIKENVIFTGKIPYDLIPAYYKLFNILTSFSTTETQGLTIIEALASQKPVICIKDESFKKMITPGFNGYLFNDPKDYQKIIKKLITNPKEYQKLQANTLKSISQYTKEAFAKYVLKVYKKTLKI